MFGFHKMRRISSLAVEMLAFQEELFSIDFVRIATCYRNLWIFYWFHVQGLSSSRKFDLRRSSPILTVIIQVNRHHASIVIAENT
jgi:hypothetical protein